jgi:hypothetical protein
MFLKRIFTLALLTNCIACSWAQLIDVSPSGPSANIAGSNQNLQLGSDLFNGRVNVSIPIYSYSDAGITVPITLNYSGGNGIKTDELPSWVGLGWNVQAGGYVRRTVRGKPDEAVEFKTEVTKEYNTWSGYTLWTKSTTLNQTNHSYFAQRQKISNSFPNWYTGTYANTLKPSSDNYPIYGQPVPFGYFQYTTDIYNHTPLYDLVPDEFSFSVGNVSGKFYYNQDGEWIVVSNDGKHYDVSIDIHQEIYAGFTIPKIIRWLTLTSSDGMKYYFGNHDPNSNGDNRIFEFSRSSLVVPTDYASQLKAGATYVDVVPHTWHLVKIENTKTGGTVTFEYKQQGLQFSKTRHVWGIGNTLIYGNVQTYGNWGFNYDLRYNLSAISKVLTRPWTLASVNFSNGVKFKFNSAISNQLSSNDDSYHGDGVGFLSYEELYHQLGSNSLLKLNNILISSGTEIKKEISFSYSSSPTERLKLRKIQEKSLSGSIGQEYNFFYTDDQNNIKLPPYGSTKHDHWGYFNNKDFFASVSPPYDFSKQQLYPPYRDPNTDESYSKAEMLQKIVYPTGGSVEFEYEAHNYGKKRSLTDYSISSTSSNEKAGGVRIKSIISKKDASSSSISLKKEFEYVIPGTNISSGVLSSPPPNYLIGTTSANSSFRASGYNSIFYDGNHVTYTYVTEKIDNNGRTEHEFSNFDNGFNDVGAIEKNTSDNFQFNYSYSNKSFKRGKLLSTKYFKEGSTNPIKEVVLKYEHDLPETNKKEIRSLYIGWIAGFNYASVVDKIYNDNLLSAEEKQYEANGNIATKSSFEYDSYGNLKEKKSTNSKGKVVKETYKYAHDNEYSSSGTDVISLGIKKLNEFDNNRGLKAALIEQVITEEDANGSNKIVIAATLTSYKTDKPLVDKVYTLKITSPISFSSFTQSGISNGSFVMDSRYGAANAEVVQYDSKANLIEALPSDGIRKSTIWGYNQTMPIAQVANATSSQIAYTSFEDSQYGGWSLSPGGTLINSNVITGKKTFSGVINKTVPQGDYIVTMWAAANCSVNSQTSTPLRVSNRDGWWRYFEWKLTNVSSIQVWGDNFDEVRLYPVGAQMTTYTYDPLVGLTSQNDENNLIQYYQYDEYGRLILIRDKDYNVIKKHCYNYAGQQEGCSVYLSQVVDGNYTKQSGCPPGQVGAPYPVYLPEGLFVSTTSQLAANNLAEQYAQSLANTNGTCKDPDVTVLLWNYTGNYYYVSLQNTQTNEWYGTWLYAYEYDIPLDVPAGTYNIYVSFDTQPYDAWFYAGGYSAYGTNPSFYNVTINYQNRYIWMQD